MEKSTLCIFIPILYLLLLLFSINPGEVLKLASAQEKTWCVAKPSASEAELGENINYVCNILIDCKIIKPNGACYYPNTMINHASVVMNLYYQFYGRNLWNCDFKKSGLISKTDPSYEGCQYA